jgi:hypothetical protein
VQDQLGQTVQLDQTAQFDQTAQLDQTVQFSIPNLNIGIQQIKLHHKVGEGSYGMEFFSNICGNVPNKHNNLGSVWKGTWGNVVVAVKKVRLIPQA